MQILKSKITDGANLITIILDERFGFDNVQQIKTALSSKKLKRAGIRRLEFDFQTVKYMDTAGIALLIYFANLYPDKIRCRNVSENLLYVFELNELTRGLVARN